MFEQRGLVSFDRQDVVCLGINDRLGRFYLAMHGVELDDRAGQFEQFEKLWDGRDFIALAVESHFPQAETGLSSKGRDRMKYRLLGWFVKRTTQYFTVDGNALSLK